jgi:hypothetical protein
LLLLGLFITLGDVQLSFGGARSSQPTISSSCSGANPWWFRKSPKLLRHSRMARVCAALPRR